MGGLLPPSVHESCPYSGDVGDNSSVIIKSRARPTPGLPGCVSQDLGQVQVRAFHMPGHTAGHCVLLVEPEGVAFIGDIDLTGFGPYYGDASSSLRDFRNSLMRLPDIPAKVWVTAHHRGVYTDREHFLRDLAATQPSSTNAQRLWDC